MSELTEMHYRLRLNIKDIKIKKLEKELSQKNEIIRQLKGLVKFLEIDQVQNLRTTK